VRKKIGKTNSYVKDFGCTITCISMLSDWYGKYRNPAWMAKNLRYVRDLLIWKSVTEKLNFEFVWRFYKYEENRILKALKGKKTACVLQIKGRHWVVGVRKSIYPWSRWFKTVDPWTGRYKWYHKNDITGGATFIKD